MTDEATADTASPTSTPARLDIDDLAHLAVTDPTKLTPAQTTRLGDWILDHEAHVLAHNRLIGMTGTTARDIPAERRAARQSELMKRIEPSAPGATGPTIEHLPEPTTETAT